MDKPESQGFLGMQVVSYLIEETISEWGEDKASSLAAALAFYVAFSLGPTLVIAIAVVGLFYDKASAQTQVINQITGLIGPQGGELVAAMLKAARDMGSSWLAAAVGFVGLIFGATGVFGQLQDSLNTIWDVEEKPGGGLLGVIKKRFLSLAMVIGIGLLLLASLVISAGLTALEQWSQGLLPGFDFLIQPVNFVVSFLVITALFALLFKFVPDVDITWRDVWLGAAVTSLLFTIGKLLIGLYLVNTSALKQFGAAGSLAVILLWIYYSAQISFFGAEFTQVYANRFGSRAAPNENHAPLRLSIPSNENKFTQILKK